MSFSPQVLSFSTRKERKDLKIRANLVLTGYALSKIEKAIIIIKIY